MSDGQRGARAEDVASPAAIVNAAYDVLSGLATAARDWQRFRSLYLPAAVLMPVRSTTDDDSVVDVFDVESYIRSRTPLLASADFYEIEVRRAEFRFGNLAHVLSHYESRRHPGQEAFSRGINSIQLFWDSHRWWIMAVTWETQDRGVAARSTLQNVLYTGGVEPA